MSFPKYPAYKDSGVEWLGEVPEHWELAPLKWLVELITEKAQASTFQVGLENIESWTGQHVSSDTQFSGDGIAFIENDLLFGKLRPYLAKALLARRSGEAVGDFFVLRPKVLVPSFLANYMLCPSVINELDASTTGAKMPRVTWESMGSLMTLMPPTVEQMQIACFLNSDTGKIDTLIAEQQRLMEQLEEKRRAVISHAVTKGLDPSAPMKDSGIDWLGAIPESWQVRRSKYLFIERNVKALESDQQLTASQKYGVIPQKLFSELEGQKVMQVIVGREILKKAEVNDFVISMRSFQGGIEFCEHSGAVSSAYVPLVATVDVCYNYFKYLFKSSSFILALQQTSNLVRDGQALRYSNFAQLSLPCPEGPEQSEIASFLDEETSKIDDLLDECRHGIEILQERRSALISAAVTGKIDVRNWQPPEAAPEPAREVVHG